VFRLLAIVRARELILKNLVSTRKAADRAVNKARHILTRNTKSWNDAKARIPVAEKVLKDARAAIVKAHADKKSAVEK
jgi:hypothetical protein